jgi:ABC-type nitrate/sulfonate/bicarbonate transport system permease component
MRLRSRCQRASRVQQVAEGRLTATTPRAATPRRSSLTRYVPWEPLIALVGLLGVWELLSSVVGNRVLLPPPSLVFASFPGLVRDGLFSDILASLFHLATGFTLGVLTGFLLAVLVASFRRLEVVFDPLVEILRPISGIAWIPIAILMFGISDAVPIFLIFYVSLFPIFLNTLAGIRSVDQQLIDAAAVLGARRVMTLREVIVPGAAPLVLAGVRLSLGVSWMTLIAAELVGADSGLGWRAFWYEQFFSMHKTMAIIITIGVLGYLLDSIVRLIQRSVLGWSTAEVARS